MDSGINPDSGGEDDSQVEVELSSLEVDGHAPQEGDTVDFAIEATVTSIQGDMAMVKPTKVNGQPVEDNDQDEQSEGQGESEPSFSQSGDYMGQ